MPQQTTTFRLLLISPSDVAEERQAVDELYDLQSRLLNAENKPFKVRDQQAIDAIKAQLADVRQRLKNFREDAAKVATENFPSDEGRGRRNQRAK